MYAIAIRGTKTGYLNVLLARTLEAAMLYAKQTVLACYGEDDSWHTPQTDEAIARLRAAHDPDEIDRALLDYFNADTVWSIDVVDAGEPFDVDDIQEA